MKKFVLLLALVAVIGLAYVSYMSIATPVSFESEVAKREVVLQKQLKKIAKFEEAYQDVNGRYATIEELKDFLQNGKVYYVRAEGEYSDAMRDQGLTEAEAARRGLLVRDTVWVSAKDSLLKGEDVNALFAVLGTDKLVKIDVGTVKQEVGNDSIDVPVFQATIPYEDYLADQSDKLVETKRDAMKRKANGYGGLRIGSLSEVKTTGNWE